MVARLTTLTPLLRSLAMATLLCWLGALVLCATECSHRDADHHQEGQNEMGASHSDNDSTPDSENHSGHDDSACATLKTFAPTVSHFALLKLDFGFYALSFILPQQTMTDAPIKTSVSRQPTNPERLLKLEVCFGAAFHSLAPPILA